MSKVLTVSIAAYNVEKFLSKTLDSFIDESILDDIEVIIVDDGSKDKTAEIGKTYENKYPNTFKLISKENGGHGSTINTGIKNATGKYFKIVDGDDWVNTSDFVELIKKLKNATSDVVICDYIEVDDISLVETPKKISDVKYEIEYSYDNILRITELCMHQITIKTNILKDNNIELDEHCFYVDAEYIILPIPFINTIEFYDLNVYMYRVGLAGQSVSKSGKIKHINDHVKVTKRLTEYAELDLINSLSAEKKLYIKWFASRLVRTTIGIYLSFPFNDKTVRAKLTEFDKQICELSEEVYDYSKRTISFPLPIDNGKITSNVNTIGDKRVKFLRKTNFYGWRTSQFFVDIIKKS